MLKNFVTFSLVEENNICNYQQLTNNIVAEINNGQNLVLVGKRNIGKTSLILNKVIPFWKKSHKDTFVLYTQLMDVKDLDSISERISLAFMKAYNSSFKGKAIFKNAVDILKNIGPILEVGQDGNLSFSLRPINRGDKKYFQEILEEVNNLKDLCPKILIVIDEFQDVVKIKEGESLLRESLEQLHSDISVILLGSKMHLIQEMIGRPKSAFFSWGNIIQFPLIDYDHYTDYINERFQATNLKITNETSVYLQDQAERIPESINEICIQLQRQFFSDTVIDNKKMVDDAIIQLLQNKSMLYEEKYLRNFTIHEESVCVALAKSDIKIKVSSKEFSQKVPKVSESGIRKIIKRFYDLGIIYREREGIYFSDPLFKLYLQQYRLLFP